jgi:lytic murein transglycosylase
MSRSRRRLLVGLMALTGVVVTGEAMAAGPTQFKVNPPNCQTVGTFDKWLGEFKREAVQKGIMPAVVSMALDGMTHDPSIIQSDRRQSFFAQTFLDFSSKLATANRVTSGQANLKRHAAIFERASKEFGVPPAVITAFWALESDFGAGMGKKPVLKSLATLAWDCRRGEMFRHELTEALRIIERGDLTPADMIGSWAGELGQTQFLPSHYYKHGVDYDGDGKRNLFRSPADIIASTSAFILSLGWQKGQPWLEEVRVPANMAWEQAELATQHPRSYWAKAGVTRSDGRPITTDGQPASLLLLQGRGGPAFLAYPNFKIFTEWNQSLNYATTAAYLATRIDGAKPMYSGASPATQLPPEQLKELQVLLLKAGMLQGEPDGKMGYGTRAAVKQAQLKFGLPADSYPTADLIPRLQGRR